MHLFSFPVLLGAALVSSPALWSALVGQVRLDVGLSRYLIAVALSWVALTVVATLVGPAREGVGAKQHLGEAEPVGPDPAE